MKAPLVLGLAAVGAFIYNRKKIELQRALRSVTGNIVDIGLRSSGIWVKIAINNPSDAAIRINSIYLTIASALTPKQALATGVNNDTVRILARSTSLVQVNISFSPINLYTFLMSPDKKNYTISYIANSDIGKIEGVYTFNMQSGKII